MSDYKYFENKDIGVCVVDLTDAVGARPLSLNDINELRCALADIQAHLKTEETRLVECDSK